VGKPAKQTARAAYGDSGISAKPLVTVRQRRVGPFGVM